MRIAEWPDTILEPQTITKLLAAMKVGVIQMAYFPELYFPPRRDGEVVDIDSRITPEEDQRFREIRAKIRYIALGELTLSRHLKLRLLGAIRLGRINARADFPELMEAYQRIKQDWSAVSQEEMHELGDICRKITA